MELELTTKEAEMLRDILGEYLIGVRREASRTERRDARHELVMRQELCETMIERLDAMRARVA